MKERTCLGEESQYARIFMAGLSWTRRRRRRDRFDHRFVHRILHTAKYQCAGSCMVGISNSASIRSGAILIRERLNLRHASVGTVDVAGPKFRVQSDVHWNYVERVRETESVKSLDQFAADVVSVD
jgi:hypothetical protein